MKTSTGEFRSSASPARTIGSSRWIAASSAALVAFAFGIAGAPAASATGTCAGQTFTANGTCTVDPGETVTVTIKGGDGGSGGIGNGTPGTGGQGGIGAKATGTYTNTSGAVETITLVVGARGDAGSSGGTGVAGTNGTDGGSSELNVGGFVVQANGGTKGIGGSSSGVTGLSGANGTVFPSPLPTGWSTVSDAYRWANGSVVFAAAAPDAPVASEPSATPDPILQEFGMPASGSCAEAAPASLNWAGVPSGGWGVSWGQWEGYVGPVCVRTLIYSNSLGAWTVA